MTDMMELTREQMIEELKRITVAATPTVLTMDMGLEYDYITSNGAGSSFGNMGEWPVYKLNGIDKKQWKLIREKAANQSLSEEDFAGTDIGRIIGKLHNIYGDYYDEYYADTAEVFQSVLSLPEVLPDVFYCLLDARSWGDIPKFFPIELEVQNAFIDEYCFDIVEWDSVNDVEFWYDRLSEDLGGLAMIDYTDFEDEEENLEEEE